jgi:transposase
MCKRGVKSDFFINFMDKLKKMDIKNQKYYLLDNARVHKSKKFNEYLNKNKMKIVYNAPYHSETNPIENIFSMLRNNLNIVIKQDFWKNTEICFISYNTKNIFFYSKKIVLLL